MKDSDYVTDLEGLAYLSEITTRLIPTSKSLRKPSNHYMSFLNKQNLFLPFIYIFVKDIKVSLPSSCILSDRALHHPQVRPTLNTHYTYIDMACLRITRQVASRHVPEHRGLHITHTIPISFITLARNVKHTLSAKSLVSTFASAFGVPCKRSRRRFSVKYEYYFRTSVKCTVGRSTRSHADEMEAHR